MLTGVRVTAALTGLLLAGLAGALACPCCRPTPAGLPACCAAARPAAPADKAPGGAAADDEAEIKANLAKLSDDDRKLAQAQKWCAVQTDHPLGAMGVPIMVMVKDQPVFLCCKGCLRKAKADPDKTLATVKELKAKAAAPDK